MRDFENPNRFYFVFYFQITRLKKSYLYYVYKIINTVTNGLQEISIPYNPFL
jgi:hypothetical protein